MNHPTDPVWERAVLLAQRGRPDLAVAELRRLLGSNPEHAAGHALLAQLLADSGDLAAALAAARRAVALQPDLPFTHHVLASVHWRRDELPEAGRQIQEALRRAPDAARHHALLAQIRLEEKRWGEALAAADAGLAQDAQHVDCLNLRSLALVHMGRKAEATDTLDASLAHDPDNPYTHQARGFALLHRGDAAGALHHFQEALRREPTLEGARLGLVEALKSRNRFYRLVLALMLWLQRFTEGRQQQILFGAWLAMFAGRRVLDSIGSQTAAAVLGVCWFGVVLVLACTVPLFNLLLLLHPLGRHALDPRARLDAVLLGGAVLALLGVLLHSWLGTAAWSAASLWFWVAYLLPVAGIGVFGNGWARRALQLYCVLLLAAALAWSVRLEWLIATLRVDQAAAGGSATALVPKDAPALRSHLELFGMLLLATMLSTWFVLLAPKGRRR